MRESVRVLIERESKLFGNDKGIVYIYTYIQSGVSKTYYCHVTLFMGGENLRDIVERGNFAIGIRYT